MKKTNYRWELFSRLRKDGKKYLSVRFFDENGVVFLTRATGKTTKPEANAFVAQLIKDLPLERLARAKQDGFKEELDAAERLKGMPFADYVLSFWSPDSDYLLAKAEEGKPLSKAYISTRKRYAERFVVDYMAFKRTPLSSISFFLIERFVRHLRTLGEDGNTIEPVLRSLQAPISWAIKRGLVDDPFVFAGISHPSAKYRERGILTTEEVQAIVDLPVSPIWIPATGEKAPQAVVRPRPRQPAGKVNAGTAPIDIRMKAAVFLSVFGGMRRGEIRGLKWESVDFEQRKILVVNNFTDEDGDKAPKQGSVGEVPISDELLVVMEKLRDTAKKLGRFSPDDRALFNEAVGVPIATSTLTRGFKRTLELIGISEAERTKRNLVLHSGRHYGATKVADKLGERAGRRFTRHKSMRAFAGYANHNTKEADEAVIDALRLPKVKGTG